MEKRTKVKVYCRQDLTIPVRSLSIAVGVVTTSIEMTLVKFPIIILINMTPNSPSMKKIRTMPYLTTTYLLHIRMLLIFNNEDHLSDKSRH